jgi:hypothetical protein
MNGMVIRLPSFEPDELLALVYNALYLLPVVFGVAKNVTVPYDLLASVLFALVIVSENVLDAPVAVYPALLMPVDGRKTDKMYPKSNASKVTFCVKLIYI